MSPRFCLALAAAVAACSPPSAGVAPAPSAAAARSDSTVVALERTPCFGSCPVYRVTISRTGVVRFTGTRFTAHQGEASAEIPAARVDSLIEQLRAGGYFELADRYTRDAEACGRYSTDSPTVITSVVADGVRKEIRHDYGCADAPRELARLERRIDEVAGTARWIGR